MTSINSKLGLKAAGRRSMMKLPKNRVEAIALTAAQCPACNRRGVQQFTSRGVTKRVCSWCGHVWSAAA